MLVASSSLSGQTQGIARSLIEYVVVHELMHLLKPPNNAALWDGVEQIVSDWSARKRWLAENAADYRL